MFPFGNGLPFVLAPVTGAGQQFDHAEDGRKQQHTAEHDIDTNHDSPLPDIVAAQSSRPTHTASLANARANENSRSLKN